MTIVLSVFLRGYRGKTVDFQEVSHCHGTTTAYFLNHGKWDDLALQDTLKSSILQIIYQEALRSGQPIYCIVDDTIASHAHPSSQAMHPIEAAYFHQSHLKGCQDYGHQVVSVMLSCNGIILNYAIILYDKSKSKIQIVQEFAQELPVAPVISYFLCDSWYTSARVMDCFIRKGFYTIGALKTNRILYPCGVRQKASEFALHLRKTDPGVRLVTVGSREFYVYCYEGSLNDIPNAAVILSYPKNAFGNPRCVYSSPRMLICRQRRYWKRCMHSGSYCVFEEGYASLKQQLKQEQLANLYRFIKSGASFEEVFKLVG